MAENTKIQWCDHTFNPWVGCSKVHTGCKLCYAEALMAKRYGRVQWGPDGTRSRTKTWGDPVRWNRQAAADGTRRKVFCASLADVFEDRAELRPWRADLFRLIDATPHLDWLLLTKRPENVPAMWHTRTLVDGFGRTWGETEPTRQLFRRDNVWLGTSVSDQATADEWVYRLRDNCRRYARFLFLSVEPLIGPIDFTDAPANPEESMMGQWSTLTSPTPIDWVIVGGESDQGGEKARPCEVEWVRSVVSQCRVESVPVFVKQLGSEWAKSNKAEDKHGGDPAEWPDDLRVRECPESYSLAVA